LMNTPGLPIFSSFTVPATPTKVHDPQSPTP
jgi:hypothetical protein